MLSHLSPEFAFGRATHSSRRELVTLAGGTVRIPDPQKLVHLQMRRYAGCPICSLHLRSFVRRKGDLDRSGVREVAVFYSSAEALRKVHTELPFDVVPDPTRQLYAALGVTTSPRALFHPLGLRAAFRAALAHARRSQAQGSPTGLSGSRRTSSWRRKVGSSRRSMACTPTTNGRSTSSWRW